MTKNRNQKNNNHHHAESNTDSQQSEVDDSSSESSSFDHLHTSPDPLLKKFWRPNEAQLDLLETLPNIKCFCNQPAHKSYTAEYGPIYECASFDFNNVDSLKFASEYICGFHVHERPWLNMLENLERKNNVNLQSTDLRACPQYNFTICSIFRVANTYALGHPDKVPNCFCGLPVLMRVTDDGIIKFSCRNLSVAGRKKCSWLMSSTSIAFPKTEIRLHRLLDREEYFDQRQQKREDLIDGITDDFASQFLSSMVDHQLCLSDQDPQQASTPEQHQESSDTAQLDNRTHCLTDDTIPSTLFNELNKHNEQDEFVIELQKLVEMNKRLSRLQADVEREKVGNLVVNTFTTNYQERLSSLETEIVRLTARNKKLAEDNRDWRAKNEKLLVKEEVPTVCIACKSGAIEYCLKPCYHYGYCEACAIKSTNCVVCGWEAKGSERVYRH